MPITIEMPKLSDTMTEGTLLRWIKKVGDSVEVGDVIAEVETDKATMEMEAFDEGTLAEVYVEEGQKIGVGQKLAILTGEGEEAPAGCLTPGRIARRAACESLSGQVSAYAGLPPPLEAVAAIRTGHALPVWVRHPCLTVRAASLPPVHAAVDSRAAEILTKCPPWPITRRPV